MSRRLQRLVALCLLLVWGPAAMCCAMEAAGWDALCVDAACHAADGDLAATDGCNAVEAGDYQSTSPVIKTAPLVAVLSGCFPWIRSAVADVVIEPAAAAFERPRDWLVSWQFVRRAAAPAHAPDSLNA